MLFSKDDNDDMGADYIKFFSGSAASSDQPQLIVTYSSNSGGTNSGNQPPVIISNGGQATAGINIAENSTAVTTVIATDTEAVTYSILGGQDSALFSITTDTGLLTLVTAPDYEALSLGTIYHVTVQASDGSLMASQDIAVTVTNVNEYAPEITSNANISLPEKSAEVTIITASDADLQTLTYSIIGGTNAALFSLNPSDGKLSFVTAPSYIFDDASVDNTYHVTVQASDGALNDQQEISVRILNPNNTSGITFLHEFGGQQNNGRIPYGTLLLYNDFLYGTTTYGGPPYNVPPTNPANKGNVFRVKGTVQISQFYTNSLAAQMMAGNPGVDLQLPTI
ncbi:MAG: cadherin repeat domain-containing protein [Anaerolineales bacterium]|nr:cadherin repeat domain-containing protein [Anaerolineales bacterium]